MCKKTWVLYIIWHMVVLHWNVMVVYSFVSVNTFCCDAAILITSAVTYMHTVVMCCHELGKLSALFHLHTTPDMGSLPSLSCLWTTKLHAEIFRGNIFWEIFLICSVSVRASYIENSNFSNGI